MLKIQVYFRVWTCQLPQLTGIFLVMMCFVNDSWIYDILISLIRHDSMNSYYQYIFLEKVVISCNWILRIKGDISCLQP
jgi:hypothetical protein